MKILGNGFIVAIPENNSMEELIEIVSEANLSVYDLKDDWKTREYTSQDLACIVNGLSLSRQEIEIKYKKLDSFLKIFIGGKEIIHDLMSGWTRIHQLRLKIFKAGGNNFCDFYLFTGCGSQHRLQPLKKINPIIIAISKHGNQIIYIHANLLCAASQGTHTPIPIERIKLQLSQVIQEQTIKLMGL